MSKITIDSEKMLDKLKALSEIRQQWSEVSKETRDEGISTVHQRHAGFTVLVKDYTSFDDFLRDWEDLMTLFGVEVNQGSDCISLYIQTDYTDYEQYHVIMGKDSHLTMSAAIWQNAYCANSLTNIFTGESLDEEDITTCFPPEYDNRSTNHL